MSRSNEIVEPVDDLSIALQHGLRAERLTADAMERIRTATMAEWRASLGPFGLTHRWSRFAIAATVAIATLVGGWMVASRFSAMPSAAGLGQLARADYPGVVERHLWSRNRPISVGETLRESQDILVGGGARISIAGGGSLRLTAGTGIFILSDHHIRLNDGDIYVDIPPTPVRQLPFIVQTPAGTFTHIGTQFHVAVRGDQTQVRVREGLVRWQSASGDVVSGAGTQLLIDAQGHATKTDIATTGVDWVWAEALGATFDIENRSLADFLRFIARETGRKLEFASPAVERRASALLLHGSIQRLAPADALSAVMSTTSLRYTLGKTYIRIDSAGDPATTIRK